MKISPNAPCPCHSGKKYKQCCHPYHKGILPANAMLLMRSRYCAYALGMAEHIIRTTHPDNPDFTDNVSEWKEGILEFCRSTPFNGLQIVEFIDGESEAYVSFEASLGAYTMKEKSRFLKAEGKWLYESGEFPE